MAIQLTLELFDDIESSRQETIAVCVRPAKHPEFKSLKASYLSLAELPGIFPADFRSRVVEDIVVTIARLGALAIERIDRKE